ncbi:acyl carrier protein 2 [Striga asiatica]|uniref:Acyl carrier protein 2 n=1 Tax=Striga asiatica TaxID=4170 RepID=A0A5A7PFF4_STRAF|nr:acyl carrier protein 2 [Striga asiatica]
MSLTLTLTLTSSSVDFTESPLDKSMDGGDFAILKNLITLWKADNLMAAAFLDQLLTSKNSSFDFEDAVDLHRPFLEYINRSSVKFSSFVRCIYRRRVNIVRGENDKPHADIGTLAIQDYGQD